MRHTTRLIDIIDRSLTGPVMEEEAFNKQVTKGIRRVVKEYDIVVGKDHLVNLDDGLADRVWQAAIDFLAECGVYNMSTGRVILHDRDEILRILSDAPPEVLLGEGLPTP